MKKALFLSVLCAILYSGIAYGANVCDVWEGTWDVKLTSGTAVWEFPGPATSSPPFIVCKTEGTSTSNGTSKYIVILQVSFFAGKFIYSEDKQLSDAMGKHELIPSADGCSFTTEGAAYTDYDIVSGTKRGGECETQTTTTTIPTDNQTECIDNDNDTYGEGCTAGADCNDNDPAINPGATEICGDGIDQNCDGTDDTCPPTCTITLSKTSFKAGRILPRVYVLTITGSGEGFDNTGAVNFSETGVTKLIQTSSGTNAIKVIGLILPQAQGKTVTVSVTGCDGTADITIE